MNRAQEPGQMDEVLADGLARQVDIAVGQAPFHPVGRGALKELLAGGLDDEAGLDTAPPHDE